MDTSVADAIVGSEDPVKAFVDERLLFNELAGNEILLSAMRSAYQKVNEFIERREEASIAS